MKIYLTVYDDLEADEIVTIDGLDVALVDDDRRDDLRERLEELFSELMSARPVVRFDDEVDDALDR